MGEERHILDERFLLNSRAIKWRGKFSFSSGIEMRSGKEDHRVTESEDG